MRINKNRMQLGLYALLQFLEPTDHLPHMRFFGLFLANKRKTNFVQQAFVAADKLVSNLIVLAGDREGVQQLIANQLTDLGPLALPRHLV